jgi:hypothetical protein
VVVVSGRLNSRTVVQAMRIRMLRQGMVRLVPLFEICIMMVKHTGLFGV